MSWAARHIERLRKGETVSFRPQGNSMSPRIESGQLCTVQPITRYEEGRLVSSCPLVGDIVLVTVGRATYLHLVKGVEDGESPRVLIGNNKGRINGWTTLDRVHGKLIAVSP